MNVFDDVPVARESFAFNDLSGQDKWESWDPTFSVTVVGTPTYVGRYKIVGRIVFFQATFSASTSIETTSGVSYMELPIDASGIGGMALIGHNSALAVAGGGFISNSTSRCYLPTAGPVGGTFSVSGWYEI